MWTRSIWVVAGLLGGCIVGPKPPKAVSDEQPGDRSAPAPTLENDARTTSQTLPLDATPAAVPSAAKPPCTSPSDIAIVVRNGHVSVNGKDVEAVWIGKGETPAALTQLLYGWCTTRHYLLNFETDASVGSTGEVLSELPVELGRVESLAFEKSSPVLVRFATTSGSKHWVRLISAQRGITARELQRNADPTAVAPTVVGETALKSEKEAYSWLRSTCAKQPCDGIILTLSPDRKNTVIESALAAIHSEDVPTPLLDVRSGGANDSNRLAQLGRIPPEEIQKTVRASYPVIQHCYEEGLARDPKLEGRISVRFVIDLDGSVRSAVVDSQTLPDPEVGSCMVKKFLELHFPKPDGGIVTVVYPIMFSPE
jgi:hypothetical protein